MIKKIVISFLILSFGNFSKAQNLVNNPSFELHIQCPNQISQINRCNSWYDGDLAGTCDYYSALGCTGNFSPPNLKPTGFLNLYQQPLIGKSFAGLIPYYGQPGGMPSYVEFLQGVFSGSLITNKLYYIEFYINSASQQKYFLHDMAALITNTQITIVPGNNYTPQILPLPNKIYRDTTNWMRINGYYTASGGENYITIGNFQPNGLELKDSLVSGINEAYYFVDSVGVYEVTHWDAWNAGPDRIINAGDSVRIGNPCSDYSMFSWVTSTSARTYLTDSTDSWPYAKPTQNTTYYVTKTQGTTVFKDTVNVFVNGSGINFLNNNQIFNVYPNPNNGNMFIEYTLKENAHLEITDISGKLVGKYDLSAAFKIIEIKNDKLQNGVYLYSVISNGNMLKAGKIVIMK